MTTDEQPSGPDDIQRPGGLFRSPVAALDPAAAELLQAEGIDAGELLRAEGIDAGRGTDRN